MMDTNIKTWSRYIYIQKPFNINIYYLHSLRNLCITACVKSLYKFFLDIKSSVFAAVNINIEPLLLLSCLTNNCRPVSKLKMSKVESMLDHIINKLEVGTDYKLFTYTSIHTVRSVSTF